MPESGAQVKMPRLARRLLTGLEYFTWPLRLDDYLELISPLWSTTELRGRIERLQRETEDAVTVSITPGFRWPGHVPGQYVRVGFDIAGKRHWRAYSLSSDAARPDGQVTITVKRTADGVVSRWLQGPGAVGQVVTLGEVEGEFTLGDPVAPRLLLITAGSGVTPVMAMLRGLERRGAVPDVIHLHSARTLEQAIFAEELARYAARNRGYTVVQRATARDGRIAPADLDRLVPDWRERETYACGPGELLDTLGHHYAEAGVGERLHLESFEHALLAAGGGRGGTIRFTVTGAEAQCDGDTPILLAGESAGVRLPYGCRMGICHTCTGRLTQGSVRDLRTGETTHAGTEIRTCVNCPDGSVAIEL